jgi:tRNA(fMet)-specific endonuclease VapC
MSAALYLPDTNLLSAYAANRDKALVERVEANAAGMLLSAVVLAEMEYGWRKAGGTKRVQRQKALAAALAVHDFDTDSARAYGVIKNLLLHGAGNARPIGERDMLIAAQAYALGAVLITRNVREFAAVPGLTVENWEGN